MQDVPRGWGEGLRGEVASDAGCTLGVGGGSQRETGS